jgi:hypothetical protein
MRRLTDYLAAYLDPALIAKAHKEIETPQDGPLMARWTAQFLERSPIRAL